MLHDFFTPHGFCYRWQADLILLHVASDLVIFLAYMAIPALLFIASRLGAPGMAKQILATGKWFMAFIVLCGLTHAMNIWLVWTPSYYAAGYLSLLTASVSIAAVVNLSVTVVRVARALRSEYSDVDAARLLDVLKKALS